MKVQSIQNTPDFGKTKRYITKQSLDDIEKLLFRMNQETKYQSNENYFTSTILKCLKHKDDVTFIDGRIYLSQVPKDKQMRGETLFTIGKTELVIDNKTGEITDYVKPFYVMWSRVMKKISQYLTSFQLNFDDSSVVEKRFLKIHGFTEKGLERFNTLKGQK